MTTDSQHLPSARAIERAILAANEAQQEKARMRHLLTIAITLIATGAVLGIGANIAVTAAGDGHLDWIRNWKGTAHWVGVSGVVMLAAHMILAHLRRRDARHGRQHDMISARLSRIERHERQLTAAEDAKADVMPLDSWQQDVAEAYRLGQQNPLPPND